MRDFIKAFRRDLIRHRWETFCLLNEEYQDLFNAWCRCYLCSPEAQRIYVKMERVRSSLHKEAHKLGMSDVASELPVCRDRWGHLPVTPKWLLAKV